VSDTTTTVPVVGKVKTTYVYVGAALVAGIAGYAWWRRSQADPAVDSTDGGLYADTRTGSALPTDAYANPAPNADGQSGTGIGGDSTFHAPSTDPEWASAVIDKLSWYEPGYVSATVGKYLARQPTTPDEQTLIREAWAQLGHPPGNQPLVSAPVPATPTAVPAPTGLRVTHVGSTWAQVDWNDVAGAKGYDISVSGGKLSGHKGNSLTSSYTIGILAPGQRYTVSVRAVAKANNSMGPAATAAITTKK
jgi:hypothetical protein